MDILDGIDDIHFVELTSADVVRHRLVSDIVDAYARAGEQSGLPNWPGADRRSGRTPRMSIEVSNESGIDVSEEEPSASRFVIRKMDVNPPRNCRWC